MNVLSSSAVPASGVSASVIPGWVGIVAHLHTTPRAFLPMQSHRQIDLVAGEGIVGDRYRIGTEAGFYSDKPEDGRQVTLFEIEQLENIRRDHGIELAPEEHRRNITTSGVALTHLVGRRFRLGPCLLEATRLSIPCRHIEEILDKKVFDPLINRSGLNCRILEGGTVRVGDAIRPA